MNNRLPLLKTFRIILARAGWILFCLIVIEAVLDQIIVQQMQKFLADPQGTNPLVYLLGLVSMINSLLLPTLILAITITSLSGDWKKLSSKYKYMLIESLRSWGKIIRWSFLFIIPGLVQWFRLILVPYVVLLHPEYDQGKIDALQTSKEGVDGNLMKVIGLLFIFSLLIPTLETNLDPYKTLWITPLQSLLIFGFETLVGILGSLLLLKIYLKKFPINFQALENKLETHI